MYLDILQAGNMYLAMRLAEAGARSHGGCSSRHLQGRSLIFSICCTTLIWGRGIPCFCLLYGCFFACRSPVSPAICGNPTWQEIKLARWAGRLATFMSRGRSFTVLGEMSTSSAFGGRVALLHDGCPSASVVWLNHYYSFCGSYYKKL